MLQLALYWFLRGRELGEPEVLYYFGGLPMLTRTYTATFATPSLIRNANDETRMPGKRNEE